MSHSPTSNPIASFPAPLSLYRAVSNEWVNVRAYFMEYQMAEDATTRCAVAKRLPSVAHALEAILFALRCEGNRSAATGASAMLPLRTFLFADKAARLDSGSDDDDNDNNNKSKDEGDDGLAPIGHVFFPSLCQFAKHNEPPGARAVVLDFMARALAEADVPRLPRSLLELFPGSVVVPLVDLVRCIGAELKAHRDDLWAHSHNEIGMGSGNENGNENGNGNGNENENANENGNEGLVEFLALLCAIAERIEQFPAIAAFFLPDAMDATTDGVEKPLSHTNHQGNLNNNNSARASVCLLRELTAHLMLRDASHAFPARVRNEFCRFALHGVLSLAKCPHAAVQDFLQSCGAANIAERTLTGACTALSTTCTIPHKDDGVAQLTYVCDVLRFWSQLLLLAPALAEAWGVRRFVEKSFVRDTLLPVLRAGDAAVFTAAAVSTAEALSAVGPDCAPFTDAVARALFSSSYSSSSSSSYAVEDLLVRIAPGADGEWREAKAALRMIHALATAAPAHFLRNAFSLSPMNLMNSMNPMNPMGRASRGRASGLSAAATAPPLDVAECFPLCLRPPCRALLGSRAEDFAEEALSRLLLLEGRAPLSALLQRRQRSNEEEEKDKENEEEESTPLSTSTEEDGERSGHRNIWFHSGVHSAPLVVRLCEITTRMLTLPAGLSALLTDLWSTICVMPDLRVLYTLMDPEYGRLHHALLKLRDIVDEEMQGDKDFAFAVASAAAASSVAGTFSTRENKRKETSAFHIFTRAFLYSQFVQFGTSLNWLRDVRPDHFSNHVLLAAMQKDRVFLEACACIEAFRMELDAVVGHMVLSHNLMCLETGKE